MKININHPTFILFLDSITNNILNQVSVDNYFVLSPEKKIALQYVVFRLMKNSINASSKLTNEELIGFVTVLWKKNEENENYEFSALLKDILHNFEVVNDSTKITKKVKPAVKSEKKD